jgi:hypothetical protein
MYGNLDKKECFNEIKLFLQKHGMKRDIITSELVTFITTRFTPNIAKRILDLWFSLDGKYNDRVYKDNDVAFLTECEELYEILRKKELIFKSDAEDPLHYEYDATYQLPLINKLVAKKEEKPTPKPKPIQQPTPQTKIVQQERDHKKKTKKKSKPKKKRKSNDDESHIFSTIAIVFFIIFLYKTFSHDDDKQRKQQKVTQAQYTQTSRYPAKYTTKKIKVSKPKHQSKQCQKYITTATLNIRANHNLASDIIAKVAKNKKICIVASKDKWLYIKDKGWVYSKYTKKQKTKKKTIKKKKVVHKKKVDSTVWHCSAKSQRASGWAKSVDKNSAKKSALHQCEIRRVSDIPCSIIDCYKIR